MTMYHYEYCPKCQGMRKTSLSIDLRKATGPDGYECDVLVFHYHCESCLAYIRSIEKDESLVTSYEKFPAYYP